MHFRRALAETTDAWQPHCDYAITLFHAALEPRLARHGERPWVRSSFERCELLRESAHELDVAERLSPTAEAKGYVIARRARQLAAWQLGWDAISEFTRAGAAVPRHQEQAAALLEAMRDPARSSTGESRSRERGGGAREIERPAWFILVDRCEGRELPGDHRFDLARPMSVSQPDHVDARRQPRRLAQRHVVPAGTQRAQVPGIRRDVRPGR